MTSDMLDEIRVCADAKTLENVSCDEQDKKKSNQKEWDADSSENFHRPHSSKAQSHSNSSPTNNNQKPALSYPNQPANRDAAIKEMAILMAKAQGKPTVGFGAGAVQRVFVPAINQQMNSGKPEEMLRNINTTLANPKSGNAKLNIEIVALERYLLSQINNTFTPEFKETYGAVNDVMEGYAEVYEHILDKKLAERYQQLSRNFTYSRHRVAEAQRRYDQFMQGHRFKLSKSDQKLLDDLVALNNAGHLKESAKKLYKVTKVFNPGSKVISVIEWVEAFNEAQRTQNWDKFWVKVSSSSAGMLIGAIVTLGISVSSLPVAFLIAVLGVIASNYFEDEQLWQDVHNSIRHYFE